MDQWFKIIGLENYSCAEFLVSGILAVGWLMSCIMGYASTRQKMLGINAAGILSFTIYYAYFEVYSAMWICFIGGVSCAIQAALPKDYVERHSGKCKSIALFAAVLATVLVYENPSDIMPLTAMTIFRLSEAQASYLRVKAGFCVGTSLWFIYAASQSLWLIMFFELMILLSMLMAIYREWAVNRRALLRAQAGSALAEFRA